ncbi:MAG: TetR/AcrR family transcriptional regulator [Actinomycetota bacterium]
MLEEEGYLSTPKARNIIQATYQTIVERGMCEMTTKMISERAGASKGLIHYYFDSKDMLIVEVIRAVLEDLLGTVGGVLEQYPDNRDRIDKGLSDFWEGFKADPGVLIAIYEAHINGRRSPKIRERMAEFYRGVERQLEDSVVAGMDMPGDISRKDVEAVVALLLWVIMGMTMQYIQDPENTDFDYTLAMFKRVLKTLLYNPGAFNGETG